MHNTLKLLSKNKIFPWFEPLLWTQRSKVHCHRLCFSSLQPSLVSLMQLLTWFVTTMIRKIMERLEQTQGIFPLGPLGCCLVATPLTLNVPSLLLLPQILYNEGHLMGKGRKDLVITCYQCDQELWETRFGRVCSRATLIVNIFLWFPLIWICSCYLIL